MPVSLGVPEILVGNITSGQVVLRDIQYVPTTQIKISDSNGPEPIATTPGGSVTNPTINLNTPVMPDERLVLFNRSTNSYITTTPILGKEALAQYPNIEFIGSFDSRTANLVAKELAANPPSSISAEIMDDRGKTDIGENMQILAVLNAMVTALGTRGQILKELLDSGELVPVPDIQKQWEMAAGINDFSEVSVPDVPEIIVQTSPNPIRTTKAIGEEVPPTNGPGPTITTMALGEEAPPQPNTSALSKLARREKLVKDLEAADRIMDVHYCSDNLGMVYFGRNDANTYYLAGGRGIQPTNETCRMAAQSRGDDFGGRNAIAISKEDYKDGLRRQIAELDAELNEEGIRQSGPLNVVPTRPTFSWPTLPSGSLEPSVEIPGYPINTPWEIPPMQSTMPMPSNCVKVPPGVPPVPAGCVPVRPPRPPIIRPPIKPPIRPYVPPSKPPSKPPSQPYDDSGKGVGSI